jgi:hypothetical protein
MRCTRGLTPANGWQHVVASADDAIQWCEEGLDCFVAMLLAMAGLREPMI